MRPPCAATMPRQMVRPSPTPVPAVLPARWNFSKTRSSSPAGMPGPRSATVDDHLLARRASALSSIGRPRRSVLGRVLQQVHEHLLQEDLVHRHQRKVRREVGGDRPARQLLLHPDQRDARDVRQQLPLLLHLERAALDPDHVEQVRDQPAHPLGLLDDGAGQLPAGRVVAGASLLEQRGRGAFDRGERRPHVVRERAEQRGPQALGLDLDRGAAAPLRQRHPLEGDGRLAGERLQQPAPRRIAELVPLRRTNAQDADRPVGHGERHVERDGRRQGAGSVAGLLPLIVGPLRHAHLPIVERVGRGLGGPDATGLVGQQQGRRRPRRCRAGS